MRVAISTSLLLAACAHPAATPKTTTAPPIAPYLVRWIPGDAELVIGVNGKSRSIDELAHALHVQPPGPLVRPPPEIGKARGLVWMMFDEQTFAECARVRPGLVDAIVATGATRREANGATLVGRDLWIVVVRGDVACTVTSEVESRREARALELATLAPDERLLARDDARAALAALPPSTVWAWGKGEAIGGGFGNAAAMAMKPLGELAVGVSLDEHAHVLSIALRGAQRIPAATIVIGEHAGPPPPMTPLDDVGQETMPKDDNGDVPLSAAYQEQLARVQEVRVEIAKRRDAIVAAERADLQAWIDAWGKLTVMPRDDGADASWILPAWPPSHVSAGASFAWSAGGRQVEEAIEELSRAEDQWSVAVDELLRIRAVDVAAYDRASAAQVSR